jgi:hypothetical protein
VGLRHETDIVPALKISELIPGAYYRYFPENRHCHEGIFLAVARTGGGIYPADTYWITRGTVWPSAGACPTRSSRPRS